MLNITQTDAKMKNRLNKLSMFLKHLSNDTLHNGVTKMPKFILALFRHFNVHRSSTYRYEGKPRTNGRT